MASRTYSKINVYRRARRDNFYKDYKERKGMEVVYRCCCWIDVHKEVIVACLVNGGEQELREFGTTTGEIKSMANWLTESGCKMIAMESAGVFWKPLYNLFAEHNQSW